MASALSSLARLQETVKLLFSGLAIFTNASVHSAESALSSDIHKKVMEMEHQQHKAALRIQKQSYLMESSTALEQHFQTLDADLLNSSRESERDMFDQRSKQFQTVILASTVMFTSLTMVIVQGVLPSATTDALKIAYSVTSALSFAFLFLTIVTSIEVINRASVFMYKRSRKHARNLVGAVSETQVMMDAMRKRRYAEDSVPASTRSRPGSSTDIVDIESQPDPQHINSSENSNSSSSRGGGDDASSPSEKERSLVMGMNSVDVDEDWAGHDAKVQEYLQRREDIHVRTAVTNASDELDPVKISFEQFWRTYCMVWGNLAQLFFYTGSVNLLLTVGVWVWAVFDLQYGYTPGAAIAVALVGSGVAVSSAILAAIHCNRLHIETSWKSYKDAE